MQGLIKFIKFYSSNCKPCEIIKGSRDAFKEVLASPEDLENLGVKVLEINTDENEAAAIYCKIRSVPTLLAIVAGPGDYKDWQGEIVSSFKGAIDPGMYVERATQIIKQVRGIK